MNQYDCHINLNMKGFICRNVIMWMDHRAITETDFINSTSHKLLKFVGGKMSVEMEMPKIMWIKKVSVNVC